MAVEEGRIRRDTGLCGALQQHMTGPHLIYPFSPSLLRSLPLPGRQHTLPRFGSLFDYFTERLHPRGTRRVLRYLALPSCQSGACPPISPIPRRLPPLQHVLLELNTVTPLPLSSSAAVLLFSHGPPDPTLTPTSPGPSFSPKLHS
ncbi:hypothetical protein FRC14_005026 [Serendipita sp. 396]|nr:hypothetical protein FRC14_005026 [Serendipita sp. 396]